MHVVAQGSATEMLHHTFTVGDTNSTPHRLLVWWGDAYVGTTKGKYDNNIHPIQYKIGDDNIWEWDWCPSLVDTTLSHLEIWTVFMS